MGEERATLHSVIVKNFKTFSGKNVIGPFSQLTGIVGPNGVGKSNVMDAITFALGEKSKAIRIHRLRELIHGASVGSPVANKCSVTLVFRPASGRTEKELRLKRKVVNDSTEYKINGRFVSKEKYAQKLFDLGINVKAKNFVVYQGEVENIATMEPKDLANLFEETCGSKEYKEEYEAKKQVLKRCEEEHLQAVSKRKVIAVQARETDAEAKEAMRYEELRTEISGLEVEYNLFKLYHLDQHVAQFREDIIEKKKEKTRSLAQKDELEKEVKRRQKVLTATQESLTKIERKLRDEEVKMSAIRPKLIKSREGAKYKKEKIDKMKEKLIKILKRKEEQEETIKTLKKEVKRIERLIGSVDEEEKEARKAREKALSPRFRQEYEKLKQEFEQGKSKIFAKSSDQRELETLELSLQKENFKKTTIQDEMKLIESRIADVKNRREKSTSQIEDMKTHIKSLTKEVAELQEKITSADGEFDEISKKFEEVNKNLEDAKGDQTSGEEKRRKVESQLLLAKRFPGKVFGRFRTICKPSHKRYETCFVKVCGPMLDAIIVENDDVARDCIELLKITYEGKRQTCRETFLPLNNLKVRPVEEKWRQISDVKLLIDCVTVSPSKFLKAVTHVTKNALVSEDDELASDLSARRKVNVVTLEGNYYQKNGLVSGGQASLQDNVRRWDDEEVAQLRELKQSLFKKQKSIDQILKKRPFLEANKHQLKGLKKRANILNNVIRQYENSDLPEHQKELDVKMNELRKVDDRIIEIQDEMETVKSNISKDMAKIERLRENIFKDWSKKTGISDVKGFLEAESRNSQEIAERKMNLEKDLMAARNALEVASHRLEELESEDDLNRSIKEEEKNLRKLLEEAESREEETDAQDKIIQDLNEKKSSKMAEVETVQDDLKKKRKDLQEKSKEVSSIEKAISHLEIQINGKIQEKKTITIFCRTSCIGLPLKSGAVLRTSSSATSSDWSQTSTVIDSQASLSSQSSDDSTIVSRSRMASVESEIDLPEVDFRRLSSALKSVSTSEYDSIRRKLEEDITSKKTFFNRIQHLNFGAQEKVDGLKQRLKEATRVVADANRIMKDAQLDFEEVKNNRKEVFKNFFDRLQEKIDVVYKEMYSGAPDATAYLMPEDLEEPYLSPIDFSCIPPRKRFQLMKDRSGGEKAMAALALLFAMQTVTPSPIVIMDEVDAALDLAHIQHLVKYLQNSSSQSVQIVMISHNSDVYGNLDSLIGVTTNHGEDAILPVSATYAIQLPEEQYY